MKVVINTCFGGFGLSNRAFHEYKNRTGKDPYDAERDDPVLVAIVEELGDEADGDCSKLKVVEIPDDVQYTIEEYDGIESIHEVHRSWG